MILAVIFIIGIISAIVRVLCDYSFTATYQRKAHENYKEMSAMAASANRCYEIGRQTGDYTKFFEKIEENKALYSKRHPGTVWRHEDE